MEHWDLGKIFSRPFKDLDVEKVDVEHAYPVLACGIIGTIVYSSCNVFTVYLLDFVVVIMRMGLRQRLSTVHSGLP